MLGGFGSFDLIDLVGRSDEEEALLTPVNHSRTGFVFGFDFFLGENVKETGHDLLFLF